jgi:hypothetical protein
LLLCNTDEKQDEKIVKIEAETNNAGEGPQGRRAGAGNEGKHINK